MGNNISIKEISRQAGVSIATVSRVINKNGRYSKETEERVMKIIRDNHYVPNLVAKGLRTQKVKNVGIIVPDITNEFFMKLVYEIEKNLFQAGYESFLCNTDEDEELEEKRVRMMAMQNVCSLIYVSGSSSNIQTLLPEIPTVFIDRIPNVTSENYCMLESDNIQGGYLGTRELIEQGCKKILLITDRRKISCYTDRFEGYVKALVEDGREADEIHVKYVDMVSYDCAYASMSEMISQGEMNYDGIFATSDWIALGCYAALNKHRIKVPQSVKIVGYDDISITRLNGVPITTVHQQIDVMGQIVVENLLKILNGEEVAEKKTKVPVYLVKRQSTGHEEEI